jgi:RND family efflux transporter MFP subunit
VRWKLPAKSLYSALVMEILRRLVVLGACACGTLALGADHLETRERDAGWLGVVLPSLSLELTPEIAGQVERVYVREGDTVRRGQTVALLGSAYDRQALAMTEVSLRAAEAEISRSRLELAEAENRRSTRLAMPDAFPKEEIRRAEIQTQMAAVSLEAAQARAAEQRARVAQARDRLTKAEVRAPADGKVTRRYVEPGALAGPGQPVVRLIGDGLLIVRFVVPPEEARTLRAAARVTIATGGGPVGGPVSGTFPAVIESVSPEVDPPSGMVIVVAVLDPAAGVKPGSVVRVRREGAG